MRVGTVISSADPKTTFLQLLGTAELDTGFVRRVAHLRSRGLAAKLHLALDRLPTFIGASEADLRGRLLISPSLEYLEHAYNHAKYGEYSSAPALEITVPTLNDPALAPPGQHVLSALVQYVPYALKGGWLDERERCFSTPRPCSRQRSTRSNYSKSSKRSKRGSARWCTPSLS